MAKLFLKISLVFLLLIILPHQSSIALEDDAQAQPINSQQIIKTLNKLTFHFVENKGQVNEKVKLYLKQREGSIYFTAEGIVYQFIRIKDQKRSEQRRRLEIEKPQEEKRTKAVVYNIRAEFVGVSPLAEIEGLEQREAKFNYFRGKEPDKWVRAASSYGKVMYRELYPKVDLILYGQGGRLKYDYRIKPGGKVEAIAVRYDGIKRMRINEKSQLEIDTEGGVIIEDAPVSYQLIDGEKVAVEAEYVIDDDNTVRFNVGEYRRDKELIIDPWLDYSTFLGGGDDDYGYGIAVDSSGNAYVTGDTYSSDFPFTAGAYDTGYNGNCDVFITKLDSSGSSLLYSTFLGGGNDDYGDGIAVDSSNNAYVIGQTYSNDFPTTPGAYDTSFNGYRDAFTAKIDSSGSNLLYSTVLGGRDSDSCYGIALDSSDNAYVTGGTSSEEFPTTPGAYDETYNYDTDVFITKLDSSGSSLLYSTFLGGNYPEVAYGIALDSSGNAYLTGATISSNFPVTPGAYDTILDGYINAFVTKLDSSGSSLLYSTYLGGNLVDFGEGITVDSSGNAYVTGFTISPDFPITYYAYDYILDGGLDAFISKIDSAGKNLLYSTFLGGGSFEYGEGITVDSSGNAYVTGYTGSSDFPTTPGAYDETYNLNQDAFVTKINSYGSSLLYSTYLGGASSDSGYAIAIDSSTSVYVTGDTGSSDFPTTTGAYDETYNLNSDAFVTKITLTPIISNVAVGQGPGASSYTKDFYAYNGSLLNTFKAFGAGNPNGEVSIAKGDVNGDGLAEIVVGQRSTGAASYVRVFQQDGTLLWTFQAFGGGNANGMVNVAVGDVDNDGIGEIIVGQGPGGQSYVRIFRYNYTIPLRIWRAFGAGNTNGEVRVAAGKTAGISVGQIITGQGHGGNSYVSVWDYSRSTPPVLYNTFQAFSAVENPSGGVDVGVGNFDGNPSGRDLIVVGEGGPGQTAAAPATSLIRIFHEDGTLLTGFPVFEAGYVNGRVTVSAGQADDDFADEIIVGHAVGGNSYWRVFDYDSTLIRGVKAFGAGNTNGQVDVAGHKAFFMVPATLTERPKSR